MPSFSTLKKESNLNRVQSAGKMFSVDNYFFRSLTNDLKKKDPSLITQQAPDYQTRTQKIIATPPEVSPAPLPITSEIEIKIQPPQPKVITQEKEQKESLAKIEAEKGKKIKAIKQKKAEELYKQGKTCYKKDQFELAIQCFQKCLQLNPEIKKAARYIVKSQEKLNKLQKQQQEELEKIQEQTIQQTTKEVREQSQAQLTQELELARRQAEQEVQRQTQKLQETIQDLKQQRDAITGQQIQEEQKLKKAQEQKAKIEARLQAEQKIQEEIQQQKQQELSRIQQDTQQKAAPQLELLKQQLTEQQKLLEQAEAQKRASEEKSQQIHALTEKKQAQLRKIQSQAPKPVQPQSPQPTTAQPKPLPDIDLTESLTAPPKLILKTPEPLPEIPKPLDIPSPIKPSFPPTQPGFKAPTPITKPSMPSARPPFRQAPPKTEFRQDHKSTETEIIDKPFPFKKTFIGLSVLIGLSLIGFFAYWLLVIKPKPATPPSLPKKEPSLIVKFNKPQDKDSVWLELLKITLPQVSSLSLENYQIDPAADFDPLIKQEFFYFDFDGFSLENLSGLLMINLKDKAEAEALLEKVKGRQKGRAFLENYHQYDIIKCQNQYWVFVDLFNLHYLLFSQSLEKLKLTLDYFKDQELSFVESLENKAKLAPLLTGTTVNVWTNNKNPQISIKQVLAQIDLKLPWLVAGSFNNYFTIALLDASESQHKQTRTALIFSFDDFDETNQAMLGWEKTMSHETAFLFWGLKPTTPTTLNFQGIIYKNMIIRFLKMPSADLGIYYGLSKKNLVLTSSQTSATIILDQLNP